MAYSLTYLLPESDSWQWGVWMLMTAELAKLKRWRWKRKFKVILDFVKLWTLLYWSYLRPTEAKIVKFAAEDSWRGASNNLKVIAPAALSHVCRNSEAVVRVGNEATARQRWWSDPIVETFLRWSPKRQQSLSTNVCDSRQVVRQQACLLSPLYSLYYCVNCLFFYIHRFVFIY